MSRSLIQTANETNQAVLENGIITPGTVIRRYGQCCNLVGESIVLTGGGYYTIDAIITVAPSAEGNISVVLCENGTPISGAKASATVTASGLATFTIPTTVRIKDCCGTKSITAILTDAAGTISNFAIRIAKE